MISLSQTLGEHTELQDAITSGAAEFLRREGGVDRARSWRWRAPGFDRGCWESLASLGWIGALRPGPGANGADAEGEDGDERLTHADVAVLLEELGKGLLPEPFVEAGILAPWLVEAGDGDGERRAERLARMRTGALLAIPAALPAVETAELATLCAGQDRGETVRLSGSGLTVVAPAGADAFIVPAATSEGPALFWVETGAPGLSIAVEKRVDGSFIGILTLSDVTVAAPDRIASPAVGEQCLQRASDLAAFAASAELVGVAERILALSLDYMRERRQFNRPIGSFQALQHRAVNMFIELELARSATLAAARALDEDEDPFAVRRSASQAKARASTTGLRLGRDGNHLHGAVGYTDEYEVGLFLRRAMARASDFGSAPVHRRRFAATLPDRLDRAQEQGDPLGAPVAGGPDTDWNALDDATFRASVRAWLQENCPQAFRYPSRRLSWKEIRPWYDILSRRGWLAPNWPRAYGGMGLSARKQIIFAEEFDRIGVWSLPFSSVVMLGPLLLHYGSEEQRRTYLPRILSGEDFWCQGFSEPEAGSDLASMRTRAVLDGDHWVVNGAKIWTSMAHESNRVFLLVRTSDEGPPQAGISFLLVDMESPGITVRPISNLAMREDFAQVYFDDVRVPKDNIVGKPNEGWTMAKALMEHERLSLGRPQAAEFSLRRLESLARRLGIVDDADFRGAYLDLRLDLEDGKALFGRLVDATMRRGDVGPEASMMKIWGTELFQRVTHVMQEMAGPYAAIDTDLEFDDGSRADIPMHHLTAMPVAFYGGSNEIQRGVIAKHVLRLPGA